MLITLGLLIAGFVTAQTAPDIFSYIKTTWTVLTRSNANLAKAVPDPKFKAGADGRWPLYIPQSADVQLIEESLRREIPVVGFKTISIQALPENLDNLKEQGLLYLPNAYVVPGGRFNEMYGWDSYFIQVGLLRDGEVDMARNMADNFIYQINNYGKILNANRTYYLTRSQPPFFTQMIWGVYEKTHDKNWLEASLPAIRKCYELWSTEPHLSSETSLARYWDFGEGPAPEVLSDERDAAGRTHYDLVKQYFKTHQVDAYTVSQYYDKTTDQLTPLFYKGDRSMRESGFDPSNRFGPFNIDIIHYNPVCLNSLLFLMEQQTAQILDELGKTMESDKWRQLAKARAQRINTLMWDEQDGLYFDYDFVNKRVRHYPFLTTFYPLWAGLASNQQAARIVKNLPLFERKGGLRTSTFTSGNQWDSPFGWAPLQMIAVDGLRRYGYAKEAERISVDFLRNVHRAYRRQGFIVEKYDVVSGGSDVAQNIHFGYSANQAGFGWTNAVFERLYDELQPSDKDEILK